MPFKRLRRWISSLLQPSFLVNPRPSTDTNVSGAEEKIFMFYL